MKNLILPFIAVSLLSGCADSHKEADLYLDNGRKECSEKYPKERGYYYKKAMCYDNVEFGYAEKVRNGFDVAQRRSEVRDYLSKKADAGEIGEDDLNLSLQRAFMEISNNARMEANERRRAAAMAYIAAGGGRPYQTPPLTMPPLQMPQPNFIGTQNNSVNCQSNAIGQTLYTNCH